jgi:glycosyltransferase involved in cell wall biosynthesis
VRLTGALPVPRVSVVIPAYDSAAVIGRALRSVQAQTYGDWEVVVADDASSDDTAERAAGAGARVVRSQRNLGPAGARNLALGAGSSELVAFLDADDEWLPGYLEAQVARYDAERSRLGPAVGLVACNARVRLADGRAPFTYLDQFRDRCEPLTLERVLRRNCVYISALVPRAVGHEVGWFDAGLFGTEDHDLWIRILETGRRAVLNRDPLAVYSRDGASVSSNIARMAVNNQKTYRAALRRGALPPRARRIARAELRYNRAMEVVASAWFERRPAALARSLPLAAFVAATRPGHWAEWLRVLRA